MIDRVVQRPFVLWQADAIAHAAPGASDKPLPPGVEDVTDDERREVQELLAKAVAEERAKPPTAMPATRDRGAEQPPPIEYRSWFPRDKVLSIAQSAIELYLEEHREDLLQPVATGDAATRGAGTRGGPPPAPTADLHLDVPDDHIPTEDQLGSRLGGAFEITDIRWASSVIAMGWRKLKKTHKFTDDPAPPRPLAPDARVIVVGDWGSGTQRARNVAGEIRKVLDAPESQGRELHVVHLGDTYYAGWDYEYTKRFLPYWPVRAGEQIGSYSLNGNHDMYTGGHGYFEVLLKEERFQPYHQGSSWFSLENDHWQLLGLDTSWEEHDLTGRQPAWVEEKLRDNPGRKTMLLSHHQLFSAYGPGGPKLEQKLQNALATDRIDAWLWGHEHRCVVYEPSNHVKFARCIGHGGVPVYAEHELKPPARWHLDKSFKQGIEEWMLMGFAILDFDGDEIAVQYLDEFGGPDYNEVIR